MKKIILSIVVLFTLALPFSLKAQYSYLYENEDFNVQFTYNNDGKAIEIVMKSADEDRWVNFQIVKFQKLGEDGYRYVTKNPVGNVINMDFYGNQDRLMVTIVALNDRIILRNTKHYSYDNRKFK
ncbi:MAG: hypothetical protein WCP85_09390 [Mariniphaga sp.]